MASRASETYKPRRDPELVAAAVEAAQKAKAAHGSEADTYKRSGDRKQYQLRPPFMRVGAVSQATGSAYVETDGVKVICGVYGPTSNARAAFSDKGSFSCAFEFAPFACAHRRTRDDEREEKAISILLQEAVTVSIQLDKFPKSLLTASVVVLEAGTGYLGATITCISLALADSGVELYDLVASTSVGLIGPSMFVDPSEDEQERDDFSGSVLLACMPSLRQITYINQDGRIDAKLAQDMVQLCSEGCSRIHELMQKCLVESLKKEEKPTKPDEKVKKSEDTRMDLEGQTA
mmetsp:Transcript_20010/g.49023  ORF Transcript_20010/g.49023 Transcript_20010/m.49023 type:complete len:291 (+) Transcript_20010:183-1055(+)|eukprot:CAMPEP_0114523022 /NCGR_PEP_ID=MMETSP0109-20121206/21066_1 /TAXON_ID=29199 /ORGANISM="Chlorarachnion reptans, Strain CCCM449" /LENGTH=290 /DNA_ID=CAMNT_0001704303 /DNA_START=160 /DNA_END=1032 /DNA_ORIENTATION=-